MNADWAGVLVALVTAIVGGAWAAFHFLRTRRHPAESAKETYLQIYKEVCQRFYNAAAMSHGLEAPVDSTFGDFHTPAHVEQLLPILKPMERRAVRSFFKRCADFEQEMVKARRGEGKYQLEWAPSNPSPALAKDFYRIREFMVQTLGGDLDEREFLEGQG